MIFLRCPHFPTELVTI